jgi:hypothetical protein
MNQKLTQQLSFMKREKNSFDFLMWWTILEYTWIVEEGFFHLFCNNSYLVCAFIFMQALIWFIFFHWLMLSLLESSLFKCLYKGMAIWWHLWIFKPIWIWGCMLFELLDLQLCILMLEANLSCWCSL